MNYRIGVKMNYFEQLWSRMEEPATEELYELTEKAFMTTTGQKQRLVLEHLTKQMMQLGCMSEIIDVLHPDAKSREKKERKNVWERREKDFLSREPKCPHLPSGISGKTCAVLVILSLLLALASVFCPPVTDLINTYAGGAIYVIALILVFLAFFAGGFGGVIAVAVVCGLAAGGYQFVADQLPQIVVQWIPVGSVVFICLCVLITALVKARSGRKASRLYAEYRQNVNAYRAEVNDACAYLERITDGLKVYLDEAREADAGSKQKKDDDNFNKDDGKGSSEAVDPEYARMIAVNMFYGFYKAKFEYIREHMPSA